MSFLSHSFFFVYFRGFITFIASFTDHMICLLYYSIFLPWDSSLWFSGWCSCTSSLGVLCFLPISFPAEIRRDLKVKHCEWWSWLCNHINAKMKYFNVSPVAGGPTQCRTRKEKETDFNAVNTKRINGNYRFHRQRQACAFK